jgi:tetratricopeptide (TPR) repeat protein
MLNWLNLKESNNLIIIKQIILRLLTNLLLNLKFDKALVYFKKAAKENPNNIIVTIKHIGNLLYFQTKQFKSALNYLEKTLNSPLLMVRQNLF